MPFVVDVLSRYTKPISLNILKGQRVPEEDLECLSRLTNLTSLSGQFQENVPRGIYELTNLVSLGLEYTPFGYLNCFSKLTKLKVATFYARLDLPYLESLEFDKKPPGDPITPEMANFPKLTSLTTHNSLTQEFWEVIARNCPKLKNLRILESDELPAEYVLTVRALNGLVFTSLESLETSALFEPGCIRSDTLTRLVLREPVGIEAISLVPHLTNLKELEIRYPDSYVFKYFTALSKLESLALTGDYEYGISFADNMANPSRLTSLEVTLQDVLKGHIRIFTTFSNLRSLSVKTSGSTKMEFDCLAKLTKLRFLSIECEQGTNKTLQWTTCLSDLEHLHLALPGRSKTKIAKKLSVTSLTRLTNLFCRSVASQIDVRGLTNLRDLGLTNIKDHIDVVGLETLRNLTHLIMVHSMPADQWQSFIQLTQLQSAYIECEDADADEKLDNLTVLKRLSSLMSMQSTWSGENLTRLTSLQSLTFGTKNPIGDRLDVTENLRDKLPLAIECTYFEDFLSGFSALFGR